MSFNTYAIDFESTSSQYGATANTALLNGVNKMTVEAWVKPETVSSTHTILSRWVVSPANSLLFIFDIDVGVPKFIISPDNSGTKTASATSATISTGSWQHVAAVYDGTQATNGDRVVLYINGSPVATTVEASFPATLYGSAPDSPIQLARYNEVNYYDGIGDEFRIWNTARTAGEISANYQSELVGNESGLIFYLPCDDGTGTTVDDISSSNLDVTLYNTPTWSTDVPFVGTSGTSGFLLFM